MTEAEEAQEQLRYYLSALAEMQRSIRPQWPYSSMEEFVLKNGLPMIAKPRPTGVRKGRMKECFSNATRLMLTVYTKALEERWTYCEGWALGIIPVHHAWALDSDGFAVELTWREPAKAYWGIPFKREFVGRTISRKGTYGIIDDYKEGYPLLTKPFEKDEMIKDVFVASRQYEE